MKRHKAKQSKRRKSPRGRADRFDSMNHDAVESRFDEEVLDELEDDVPDRFDLDRWREDLRERSTRRRWMRERDLKRGLYDTPAWADFDDLDDLELDE